MNIIERGKQFIQSLHELAQRTLWDWKRCPNCGSLETVKHGSYTRNPWFLDGGKEVKVQRHKCKACGPTYSETSPLLIEGSWYAREVHRSAVDHWLHLGTSMRRTAEVLRSWMGKQERYLFWKPLAPDRWSQNVVICRRARCIAGWIKRESKRKRVWRDS